MRKRVLSNPADVSNRRRFLGCAAAAGGSVSLLATLPVEAGVEGSSESSELVAKAEGPDQRYKPSAYSDRYYRLARD